MFKVILGVAAVAQSVPVKPSKKVTDDATVMPKLQLAFLVEDVEYRPSQIQKLQRIIARSGKNFAEKSRLLREEDNEIEDIFRRISRSTPNEDPFRTHLEEGYGRKRRSPQTQQNQVLPTTIIPNNEDDQIAVESGISSRVPASSLANILKAAGNPGKTPVVLTGGYGRKRRSPQTQQNQVLQTTIIPNNEDDQIAVESDISSRVPASSLANILKAAGNPGKTPVTFSAGYGRKRRSPMDSSSIDFDSLEISENLNPRGGSDRRRKRSPQKEPVHSNAHQYGLVDNPEVAIKPHGKYGDLQKILALSGAKPQKISRGGSSYGRRKKRSPQDLTNEIITNEIQTGSGLVKDVAIEAVKIKSHGNYGNIAQFYDAGANSKNVVVNGRYGRRKREDDFIPFNVYDEERVKTLKIEQNDFLALPNRLQIEKDSSDRNVKKRHFTATQ